MSPDYPDGQWPGGAWGPQQGRKVPNARERVWQIPTVTARWDLEETGGLLKEGLRIFGHIILGQSPLFFLNIQKVQLT
jgi:hypothetical protein